MKSLSPSSGEPRLDSSARFVGWLQAAAGSAFILASSLFAADSPALGLLFGLWALLPFALLLLLSRIWPRPAAVAFGGLALLAGEIGIRLAVFVYPQGSTAAVALVFFPALQTFLVLPAGWVSGYLVDRLWRRSRVLAGVLALALAGAACLFAWALARPETTPWATREREAWRERLGPPRVVVLDPSWQKTKIEEARGWVQAADLDGIPGDELAVVDHRRALLLDPEDPTSGRRIDWDWRDHSPLNGFSRLVWWGDRLVIVQAGGGYQETEVLETDGRQLWRYRPSADLPPSSLQPGPLDERGRRLFFAVAGGRLVGLDATSQELWSRPIPYGSSLQVTQHEDPWVVVRSEGRARLFDADGGLLGELDVPGWTSVFVADFAEGRRLLTARDDDLVAYTIDGSQERIVSLEGLALAQALSLRDSPASAPRLALVTAAPSDVARWRVVLFDASSGGRFGEALFEEIFDEPPRLVVARTKSGVEELFLTVAGRGLWRLHPAPGQG